MLQPALLDAVPLWALFLLTTAIVLIPVDVGYRLGRRAHTRPHEHERLVDMMVAPALGLLAFMLAFTFNLAQNRFEVRREAALGRVNAITTAFQRARLAPEPQQRVIRRMLRAEVEIGKRVESMASLRHAVDTIAFLHDTLWAAAIEAGRTIEPQTMGQLVVQSINDAMDADERRLHALTAGRVPLVLWIAIALLAMIATGLMGYDIGVSGSRRSAAVIPLSLAFSIVIFLIADLDRPMEGFITINRASHRELLEALDRE